MRLVLHHAVCFGFLCAHGAGLGNPAEEPRELVDLRASWEDANERQSRPLKLAYLERLENLRETWTKAERVSGALVVQAEIELLTAREEASDEHKQERSELAALNSLHKTYDRAVQTLRQENMTKYLAALSELRRQFLASRDLSGAAAVQEEIDKLSEPVVDETEAVLRIGSLGEGEILPLKVGSRIYRNRNMSWQVVPKELERKSFMQVAARDRQTLRIGVKKEGLLYCAFPVDGNWHEAEMEKLLSDGWTKCDYTLKRDEGVVWFVMQKRCQIGEVTIPYVHRYGGATVIFQDAE